MPIKCIVPGRFPHVTFITDITCTDTRNYVLYSGTLRTTSTWMQMQGCIQSVVPMQTHSLSLYCDRTAYSARGDQ